MYKISYVCKGIRAKIGEYGQKFARFCSVHMYNRIEKAVQGANLKSEFAAF